MHSPAIITRRIAVEHALDMKKRQLFVEMKMVPFGLGIWSMWVSEFTNVITVLTFVLGYSFATQSSAKSS